MISRYIYLLHTSKTGQASVREHLVWDAEKFYASQVDSARKDGGAVTLATQAEYIQQRNASKRFG